MGCESQCHLLKNVQLRRASFVENKNSNNLIQPRNARHFGRKYHIDESILANQLLFPAGCIFRFVIAVTVYKQTRFDFSFLLHDKSCDFSTHCCIFWALVYLQKTFCRLLSQLLRMSVYPTYLPGISNSYFHWQLVVNVYPAARPKCSLRALSTGENNC